VLEDFARTLSPLSPQTQRAYLNAARRSLAHFHGASVRFSSSADLLAALEAMPNHEKRLRFGRIHRFERFLAASSKHRSLPPSERAVQVVAALRYRPLERPLDLRDAALLAAVAVTGSARRSRALRLVDVEERGTQLALAGRPVEGAAAEVLRTWILMRRRFLRPEQVRLFRRGYPWARSPLLFPAPDGLELSRSAFSNAIRRFRCEAEPTPFR
jgi:site-specific recombinase XerD